MGEGTRPERVIREVTYEECMAQYRALLVAERLPVKPVASARYYVSEVACGALVVASKSLGRVKATATLPEWRGYGYGEDILWHLFDAARGLGLTRIEVFSRHPGWFERQGFQVDRVTKWGTPVMSRTLEGLNRG